MQSSISMALKKKNKSGKVCRPRLLGFGNCRRYPINYIDYIGIFLQNWPFLGCPRMGHQLRSSRRTIQRRLVWFRTEFSLGENTAICSAPKCSPNRCGDRSAIFSRLHLPILSGNPDSFETKILLLIFRCTDCLSFHA